MSRDKRRTGEPAMRGWRTRKAKQAAERARVEAMHACLVDVARWLDVLEHGPDEIDEPSHEEMRQRVLTALDMVE